MVEQLSWQIACHMKHLPDVGAVCLAIVAVGERRVNQVQRAERFRRIDPNTGCTRFAVKYLRYFFAHAQQYEVLRVQSTRNKKSWFILSLEIDG